MKRFSRKTGIVVDAIYREHEPGHGHPESPYRYDAVLKVLSPLIKKEEVQIIKPRAAREEEILYCHTREYVEVVKKDIASDVMCLSTGDTDICPRSYEVALFAVGGVICAVDAVMSGKVKNAFCAVRPPGHHATADRGMGFCIFNNVAIAARHAQKKHGIEKILIVDWDVHHGNGTQEIFYEDPSVFYFSIHQWPCYPGTGRAGERGSGEGKGTTLNCPFSPGTGGGEIIDAFNQSLLPAMRLFKPQMIFISAGFDGRIGDPIGNFVLTDDDFAELTRIVVNIANEYAEGRVISVLEGGYALDGLASAVFAHVEALISQ